MFRIIRDPQLPPPKLTLSAVAPPSPAVSPAFAEEAPPSPQILLPCPICFRTFAIQSLDRHKNVCQKVATKKRKVFDSSKQRVGDLDPTVSCSSPVRSVPVSPIGRKQSPFIPSSPSAASAWKEKHLSLIKTVREARAAADATRCPYCERNFGSKAFDRHLDWCREQQSRMPSKSPTTNSEAKERWEARTKYRAPALRRSVRSRDKYSPTRSLINYGGRDLSRDNSVDRLTVATDYPGGQQSLSGSRASLDSRASSSYSYQPPASQYSNISNLYGGPASSSKANTLGRTAGSAFLRQASERRSLRSAPASPPPFIFQQQRSPPPPAVLTLTPINNNRTSALRASLRMKNSPVAQQQPQHQPAKQPEVAAAKKSKGLFSPFSSSSSVQSSSNSTAKRPSVLQLFTSAFSRPSPVVTAKNRSNVVHPTTTSASPSSSHQGRRSEPEGVESSKMTPAASCYSANLLNSYGRSSSPVSKIQQHQPAKMSSSSSRYSRRNKGRPSSVVVVVPLLPNKVRPFPTNNKPRSSKRYPSSSCDYNPYLSAERQMAELFEDNRPSVLLAKNNNKAAGAGMIHQSKAEPESPVQPTKSNSSEQTSMEQLEMDLKSILSEISQLGNKDRETTAWTNKKASLNQSSAPSLGMKDRASSSPPKESEPISATSSKELPKFCHQCGAPYPTQFTVKFCCQCGSRRLFVL